MHVLITTPDFASGDASGGAAGARGLRFAALVLLAFGLQHGARAQVFEDGFEGSCGQLLYAESFDLDGPDWPSPWIELAGQSDVADVVGGESRLRPVPSGYSLGRMFADVTTQDVEVRFRMTLEDATRQGVGFYVRQNGGLLNHTVPAGEGYAVFVEGTFVGRPGVGVWREESGSEILMAHSGAAAPAPQSNVGYQVRFQVLQSDPSTTLLQARIWMDGDPEPISWQVTHSDSQPSLQGISGGIAIDSWSTNGGIPITAHTRVDDIEVRSLCNPMAMRGITEVPEPDAVWSSR